MNRSKEIIYHFTCENCKNWWSYATQDEWWPRGPRRLMWCPHCGYKQGEKTE
jgi:hypothetical protein